MNNNTKIAMNKNTLIESPINLANVGHVIFLNSGNAGLKNGYKEY